ncbi:MAG: hypothetical protein ACLP50_23520 [Solirubrobacteraceae bacterium]
MSSPWTGLPLLIDKSAWERQEHPAVVARWRAALEADALLSCAVTDYTLLFSARDAESFDAIEARLAGFRHLQMTDGVHRAALRALRDLAHARPSNHPVKLRCPAFLDDRHTISQARDRRRAGQGARQRPVKRLTGAGAGSGLGFVGMPRARLIPVPGG